MTQADRSSAPFKGLSYCTNQSVMPGRTAAGGPSEGFWRLTAFRDGASRVLLTEKAASSGLIGIRPQYFNGPPANPNAANDRLTARHSGETAINHLYLDGHVSSEDFEDVTLFPSLADYDLKTIWGTRYGPS